MRPIWLHAAATALIALAGCGGDDASGGAGGSAGAGTGGTIGGGGSGGSSASGGAPPLTCSGGAGGVAPGFHVAVDGTPGGDGSEANPWDLATALLGPASVKPGDTIYLHGGTYAGHFVTKLDGQDGAPITVRSYPGQWAKTGYRPGADPVPPDRRRTAPPASW
jgi:hypothetical protein